MTDRRAVSNTLGFVLLFGVVFFSIVAVNTVGLGALEEGRDTTIAQNAGLSMESMSDVIDDLREENTTARLSVLRGGGGTLSPGKDTSIKVTIDDSGAAGPNVVYDRTFTSIVYRLEGTEIVYEAGAVIRTQENGGGVLVDGPSFEMTDDAVFLPIVSTTSADGSSVGGSTVTTYLEKTDSILQRHRPSHRGDVIFEIQTTAQRAPVWERTMEARINAGDPCTVSGGTVTCTSSSSGSPRSVIVRDIRVTYEFVT